MNSRIFEIFVMVGFDKSNFPIEHANDKFLLICVGAGAKADHRDRLSDSIRKNKALINNNQNNLI